MSGGAPLWVSFVSPVATLVAALVGGGISYFAGRAQGRSQTRYIKSAEYVTNLRKLILELKADFAALPEHERSEERDVASAQIAEKTGKLVEDYQTYQPWLSQRARDKLEPIFGQFVELGLPLFRDEGIDDVASGFEFSSVLEKLEATDLDAPVDELTKEVERLLGTGPSWWRRLWHKLFDGEEEA